MQTCGSILSTLHLSQVIIIFFFFRQTSSSSNSSKDDKDKTMSPVYRMIHGLDDEKPRAPRMPAQSGSFDDPIFSAIAVTPLQGAAQNCGSRISAACTPAPANVECLSPVQSATLPRRMSDCTINNINNTGFIYPSDTSCNHPTSSMNSSHDSVSFSPLVEDVPFVPLCRVNSEVIVTERPANGTVLSAAECFRNGIGNKSVDCCMVFLFA